MTLEAREALKAVTSGSDLGPRKLDAWPGLIILEALSVAHNEFVRTIQQHAGCNVQTVNDYDLLPDDDVVHFDLTTCNSFAIRAYRGKLQPNGIPDFDGDTEAAILKSFRAIIPYVIILTSLDELTVNREIASESTIACFKRLFGRGRGISVEQRRALRVHVKDTKKGPGLQLLIERLIRRILASPRTSPIDPEKQITDYIGEVQGAERLPLLERAAESAFAAARNAIGEEGFKIGQLAKIYEFLGETGEDLSAPPEGGLAQTIVDCFNRRCEITDADSGQSSGLQTLGGLRSLIPKILADAAQIADPKLVMEAATDFVKRWETQASGKTLLLLSTSEREALKWLKDVDNRAGKSGGSARLTVKDLVSYFPK
jgi:hypothetical protein